MLLSEIAHKARVSPATVSRAINQPELVAPDSLARIRAVMQQHNYVPAPLNRRRGPKARLPEQRRIGVWFVGAKANNPSLNWFQDQLLQVQSTDPRYRVDLRVLFSNNPDELPRNLANEELDGVIIQGMEPSAECLAKLRELPHVWFMTRRSQSYPGDYVEPNNQENGWMAADYLKARGHKAVAVISTDPDYSAIVSRKRAFVERAEELGLVVHTILGRSNPGVSYLEIAPLHGESDTLVRRLLGEEPFDPDQIDQTGEAVTADEAYLRESILTPATKIVARSAGVRFDKSTRTYAITTGADSLWSSLFVPVTRVVGRIVTRSLTCTAVQVDPSVYFCTNRQVFVTVSQAGPILVVGSSGHCPQCAVCNVVLCSRR